MSVAVITGASAGLGLALSTELAARGWSVVGDARDAERLRAAFTRLPGGPHRAVAGDVTDPRHRDALVAAADHLGGADLLVANASTLGASPLPRLPDLEPATYLRVLETNVVAPVALAAALLPGLRARAGRVLTLSSDAAVEAYPGWAGYASSKAALDHAARVLAAEEDEEGSPVRVYAVDPGDMRTAMHQDAFPGEDISDRPQPATVAPRLLHLIQGDLPSGRYRAADLSTPEVVG